MFAFDESDLVRFAPTALKLAVKKGYLTVKGTEHKQFFALFGNLLFSFSSDGDASSLTGALFLESSIVKILNLGGSQSLSVSTVGGHTVVYLASQSHELQEWMEAIENSKFKTMSRKLEDNEDGAQQMSHLVEQQELRAHELEKQIEGYKAELKDCEQKNRELKERISLAERQIEDQQTQYKNSEKERVLLLKSRGITPKSLPLWALSENPREGVKEIIDKVKIWTGTWNLGCAEPFAGMSAEKAQRLLQPFVPTGYDIYVLGVQAGASDSVFEIVDSMLTAEGCRRVRLDNTINANSALSSSGHSGRSPSPSSSSSSSVNDNSKVLGRGDGSILSLNFTGIAIYVRVKIIGDVKLLGVTNFPLSSVESKGAVAVAMSILGRSICFITCYLEAKNHEKKREQYSTLVKTIGGMLAEDGFHINDQFHHVIWFGDMNYRLVDTSGNQMPADTIITMLEDGRLFRTLFDTHDQLNQDKRAQNIFCGFREPVPFPNFYPTYKKIENRGPVDYTNKSWVRSTYRTHIKEPFYKGGSVKERTPGFCDRILYQSMVDLVDDLVPESVPTDLYVYENTDGFGETSKNSGVGGGGGKAAKNSSSTSEKKGVADPTASGADNKPKDMTVLIDNYRSINDGEGMTVSDHSPVCATFVLRLRHDYEALLRQSAKKAAGSIHTLFTALQAVGSPGADMGVIDHGNSATPESPSTNIPSMPGGIGALVKPPLTPSKDSTVASDRERTSSLNASDGTVVKLYKYSLLPPGVYRFRLSNIKLIYGTDDYSPRSVSILFPLPYEAVNGERFVDFMSETEEEIRAAAAAESDFSLLSVSANASGSYSKDSMIQQQMARRAGSPSRGRAASPPKAGRPQSSNAAVTSKIISPPGSATKAPRPESTPLDSASGSGRRGSSPQKKRPSAAASALSNIDRSLAHLNRPKWCRAGASKTGTTCMMKVDMNSSNTSSSSTQKASAVGMEVKVPPITIVWKGDEPLDKLHISFKAIMQSNSVSVGSSGGGGRSTSVAADDSDNDTQAGHCTISLEQLCKVAMVSSGGVTGTTSVARSLSNMGRPVYTLDPKNLKVSLH